MTPKDYIDKFRMNQENYEFNRKEFISEFKKEFLESIKNHPKYKDGGLDYKYFRELIVKFQDKFNKISSIRRGKRLSKGLWNAFFAGAVVPYRKENYPERQEAIEKLKANNKSDTNKTGQNG